MTSRRPHPGSLKRLVKQFSIGFSAAACNATCTMRMQRLYNTVVYINAAGEAWHGGRKRGLTSASWMEADPAVMLKGFASGQILMWNYDRTISGEIRLNVFLVLLVIHIAVLLSIGQQVPDNWQVNATLYYRRFIQSGTRFSRRPQDLVAPRLKASIQLADDNCEE